MRIVRIVAASVVLLWLGAAGPAVAQSATTDPGGGPSGGPGGTTDIAAVAATAPSATGVGAMTFDPSVGISGYAGGTRPGTSLGYHPTGNDLEGHDMAGVGLTYVVTNARD